MKSANINPIRFLVFLLPIAGLFALTLPYEFNRLADVIFYTTFWIFPVLSAIVFAKHKIFVWSAPISITLILLVALILVSFTSTSFFYAFLFIGLTFIGWSLICTIVAVVNRRKTAKNSPP